jgi:hypothetical protein
MDGRLAELPVFGDGLMRECPEKRWRATALHKMP